MRTNSTAGQTAWSPMEQRALRHPLWRCLPSITVCGISCSDRHVEAATFILFYVMMSDRNRDVRDAIDCSEDVWRSIIGHVL
jgi:hypothetical protein